MLILDPAFTKSISKSALTLCWCWLITRDDGAMIGFTSFDMDLVIGDVTYQGITGFDPTALQQSEGLEKLDSQNLKGILDISGLGKDEIDAGLWDGAEVRKFIVDYTNLPENLELDPPKHREYPRSYFASKKFNEAGYEIQTKDLATKLDNYEVGTKTTKKCRCERVGDDRCRADLTNFTHQLTVTAVTDRRIISIDGGLPDKYFDYGLITFTSGDNFNRYNEVMLYRDDRIILYFPMPYDIAVGDTVVAIAGCNHTERHCVEKFNNFANYVGELRTPTTDTNLNTPES